MRTEVTDLSIRLTAKVSRKLQPKSNGLRRNADASRGGNRFGGKRTALIRLGGVGRAWFVSIIFAAHPAAAQTAPAWLVFVHSSSSDEVRLLTNKAQTDCTVRPGAWEIYQQLLSVLQARNLPRENAEADAEAGDLIREIEQRKSDFEECLNKNPDALRVEAIRLAAPRQFAIPLYFAPDSYAPPVGEIRIRSTDTPQQWASVGGFSSFTYVWGLNPIEIPLSLDQSPQGNFAPYAHTVIAVKGDWLQLPQYPFPFPVWINWNSVFGSPPLLRSLLSNESVLTISGVRARDVATGTVRLFDKANVVFIRQETDAFVFRLEQAEDMRCGDAANLPVNGSNARFRVMVSDLLDSNGHIRARWPDVEDCLK